MFVPKISASEFTKMLSSSPWETNPVNIEEFILSPKYLDLSKTIYPRIYDILVKIFGKNGKEFYDYNELHFIGGLGCFSGNTKIIDSTGKVHFIKNLVNKSVEIFSYNTNSKNIEINKAVGKFSGIKKTYKMLTETGREIYATLDHQFFSDSGWCKLSDLKGKSILITNKLDFKSTISGDIPEKISKELFKKVKDSGTSKYFNFGKAINNYDSVLDLACYSNDAIQKFLNTVLTTTTNNSDIFSNFDDIIRVCGLRTGEIFQKENHSIIRFNKPKYSNMPNLLWDKIVSIEYHKEEKTYDLEVNSINCNFFLYDGTLVHNSGKTYLGAIAQSYMFYKLSCMRDARNYFLKMGIDKDKPIALVNLAPSAQKAQKLVYEGVRGSVEKLKKDVLKNHNMNIMSKEIKHYTKENIFDINVFSGSSTANSIIGMNVLSAIIDETCFFEKSADHDYFYELYDGVKGRITSRFGDMGLIICISSPLTVDDYGYKKFLEIKKNGSAVVIERNERKIM